MSEMLHWSAGSTAQADLFNPPGDPKRFLLKYRSPFRSTIRRTYECTAAASTLQRADQRLNGAMNTLIGQGDAVRAARSLSVGGGGEVDAAAMARELQQAGDELRDFLRMEPVMTELNQPHLFVEFGTDDQLVGYPWELVHDGDDFLCLKHYMARYVNTSPTFEFRPALVGALTFPTIRVLLISVPEPWHNHERYQALPGVRVETQELIDLLGPLPHVELKVLADEAADLPTVRAHIKDKYQIIHFCGHANFDSNDPSSSGIVLHDGELPARNLAGLVNHSVVLSFINACQTAAVTAGGATTRNEWEARFNTFSLARAFIEAGSYFLGSRWQLSDVAAQEFSRTFYSAFLRERKPVGRAVLEARVQSRKLPLTMLPGLRTSTMGIRGLGFSTQIRRAIQGQSARLQSFQNRKHGDSIWNVGHRIRLSANNCVSIGR